MVGDTGKRVGEVPVGMKPSYIALSPDGNRVYASGNFGGDLAISDIRSKRIIRSLDVGRRPMGLALSRDGRWLYVAVCASRTVVKVDLKNEVILETFRAQLAETTNLVITPDGRKLLVAGDENRLLVIDAETGSKDSVKVGLNPSSVAVTPDGRTVFVANYDDDTVSIVDLGAMQAYGEIAVGHGPIDVATDGKRLYTCNDKAGSVSAFALTTPGAAAGAGL